MSAGIIFIFMLVLVGLSIPIGISIGLSTLLTMIFTSDVPVALIAQKAYNALDSFTLLAIPLFIFAGNLMAQGGISKRLLWFADTLVGHITGGLGMVTSVACMFFAAISGSAPATASAIGSSMIPAMKKARYDGSFACAITAAAGSIGIIIPPSIPFVVYGAATGTSVTDMFKAGILPGILIGIGFCIGAYRYGKKHKDEMEAGRVKATTGQRVESLKKSALALLLPVIMLGGIYASFFTPTESAVIGVFYAFIVSKFVYKELPWKTVWNAAVDTVLVSGATTFMVALSSSFANFLTMEQIANDAATLVSSISSNKFVILLMMNVFLLFVGCFIDNISATIILSPIFLPIVTAFGMSPVHFGIMLTCNLAIGFVTPPFGSNLFVVSSIGNEPVERIAKAVLPLIAIMIIIQLIITFFEPLTMLFVG